jgi:hypothetical protein
MSKEGPRTPNYVGIYMFSSLALSDSIVGSLLRCFEEQPVFAPEVWGPSERVKLPYKRKEVLRAWGQDGSLAWVQLLRKRVPKYDGYIDAVDRYLKIETDGSPARQHWPAFFDLAERLATMLLPRYATAHLVWPSVAEGTEVARLRRTMNACSVLRPVKVRPNGPLGLGVRTYFGGDVLEFIGRKTVLGAPAHVTETEWGGVRVDLWRELEELDGSDVLVHKWKAAMDYFRPKDVFAHPTIKGKTEEFEGTDSWKAFAAARRAQEQGDDDDQ